MGDVGAERALRGGLAPPDLAGGSKDQGSRSPGRVLLDLAVVVTNLRRCGQTMLAAKVGFFLERHQQLLVLGDVVPVLGDVGK